MGNVHEQVAREGLIAPPAYGSVARNEAVAHVGASSSYPGTVISLVVNQKSGGWNPFAIFKGSRKADQAINIYYVKGQDRPLEPTCETAKLKRDVHGLQVDNYRLSMKIKALEMKLKRRDEKFAAEISAVKTESKKRAGMIKYLSANRR